MVSRLFRRSLRKIAGYHPSHAGVEVFLDVPSGDSLPHGVGYIGGDIIIPFYPRFKNMVAAAIGSTGQINASMPNRRI